MYQDGKGFVPDEIVEDATVFILGQNPGAEEERTGRPYVGKTGQRMENTYFPVAWLKRGENVSIGNTLRCRWQGSNTLPSGKLLLDAVAHCHREHGGELRRFAGQSARKVLLVAQGSLAAKFVSGDMGLSIEKWRGFLISTEGLKECVNES